MTFPQAPRPARTDEPAGAFRLIFDHMPPGEREQRVPPPSPLGAWGGAPGRSAATLDRPSQGTLAGPDLTGVRPAEGALACHRGQAGDAPGRWRLALLDSEPAGVLLLAELPDSDDWDVSY